MADPHDVYVFSIQNQRNNILKGGVTYTVKYAFTVFIKFIQNFFVAFFHCSLLP